MRDILITAIVFGVLPMIFKNPHFGVLLWSWIGYMNPHKLGWGFATSFPFALIIGVVTIAASIISRKKLLFFWTPTVGWLVLFNVWMLITTIFSLQPEESWPQFEKIFKIQLVIFITLWVMHDREKIQSLIWIIVLSLGYYGLKGGVFTLTSGGGSHVLGPPGSFFSGNTEIGLALVMVLPLVWYLYLSTAKLWIRNGLLMSMFLIPFAILGTQSRGALLAIAAIGLFLWMKSRKKLVLFVAMLLFIPILISLMPQTWHDRMHTMKDHEQDASAKGRIQAWTFALNLAVERPLVGGGFEAFTAENYERFSPGLVDQGTGRYHDVHSIYFEVLGEHGFVGLAIFLILGFSAWRIANKIIKLSKSSDQNKWASDLASMIQVSFIGYAVGGAFLGLAYVDLVYHLLAILILVLRIVESENKPKY